MKSQKYWAKRFEMLEAAQMNKGIDYYNRLAIQYEKAAARITKEINAFYARYATENKMTLAEAKKQLRGRDLKEFRWTVEEYIEKGKTLNYSTEWAKELERASVRYRVTRLEALKLQMQQQIEALMGNEVDELDILARDIYEDGYYRTAFEIQKGFGVGASFMRLDVKKINKVIAAPYTADGLNFSERVWGKHRPELIQKLNTELVQSIIRGEDPQKLINKIAKHFDVAKRQAGNLVMTESAFFSSVSTRDSFNELDVEQFEVVATLDSHTSETCQELDGKVFPMSEYEISVTAPPFHVNCVIGDSNVVAIGDISGGSKRFYEGDIVTIKTSSGKKITCTPNHPILTNRGWLSAKFLYKGCKVLTDRFINRVSSDIVNDNNVITRMEDIIHSFAETSGVFAVKMPVTTKDFHGDVSNSKVAVIYSNSFLDNEMNSAQSKPIKNEFFASRAERSFGFNCLGVLDFCKKRMFFATDSIVRGLGQLLSFLWGGSIHPRLLLLRPISYLKAVFDKNLLDASWVDVNNICDAADADSAKIKGTNLWGGFFNSGLWGAVCSDNNSVVGKDLGNCRTSALKSFAKRRNAFAALVSADDFDYIVSVDISPFSGHVYNLQTTTHLYSCNNIITHNCRTTTCPYLEDEEPSYRVARDKNGKRVEVPSNMTYAEWKKKFLVDA